MHGRGGEFLTTLSHYRVGMMMQSKPFAEEGYAMMGAAFEVHRELGGGLLEDIYQESLEIELHLRSILFASKSELRTYYKNRQLKKRYVPDLVVCDGIVAELKAVSCLTSDHDAQLLNYMRLSRQPVGYLINFGPIKEVEWKRFVLQEFCKE
jgi:GxxExxY protein